MNENIKCPYCGSSDYTGAGFGGNDTLTCNSCGKIFIGVNAEMVESSEAHVCENIPDDVPNFGARWVAPPGAVSRPLPYVRDEHGTIKEQTVKQLFAKINKELDELKAAVLSAFYSLDVVPSDRPDLKNVNHDDLPRIAEEAADTITAITTIIEALGIDVEMRAEAIRCVNAKNKERGWL